ASDRELAVLGRGRQPRRVPVLQSATARDRIVVRAVRRHRDSRLLPMAAAAAPAARRGDGVTSPSKASDLSTRGSPRELLAKALCVPVEGILSFERIKHGLTNDSWRVQTADDRLVVRIS